MSEQSQEQTQNMSQEQPQTSQEQPQTSQEKPQTSQEQPQTSQEQPQTSSVSDQEVSQKRKSHTDRIAELESKIAKMEALYQLQGQNVVDMEVCTDLLLKGYTLNQLKQSKPYLFAQAQSQTQPSTGTVRQPPKVFAETQTPKSAQSQSSVSSDGFIKTLANMLVSKF